jgi:hypothetical protein
MNAQIIVKFQSTCDNSDKINSFVDIKYPDEDIKKQYYPHEIVIPMKKIKVKYTYPLCNKWILEYETKNVFGFTRAELAKKVCEGYQKIYDYDKHHNDYNIYRDIEEIVLYEVKQTDENIFKLGVERKNYVKSHFWHQYQDRTENEKISIKIFEEGKDEKCIVCFDSNKSVVFVPCGHFATCESCTIFIKNNSNDRFTCPICRAKIQKYVDKSLVEDK